MKLKLIGQIALICGLSVCCVLSLVLSALALMPVNTVVEIRETVTVSSAPLSADESAPHEVSVSGAIRNTTEQEFLVERLEIPTVTANGQAGETITFENILLPARGTVTVAKAVVMAEECRGVGEIHATVKGESIYLRNPAEQAATVSLIPLFLTLVLAYLLVRSCKVLYYMAQEERAARAEIAE